MPTVEIVVEQPEIPKNLQTFERSSFSFGNHQVTFSREIAGNYNSDFANKSSAFTFSTVFFLVLGMTALFGSLGYISYREDYENELRALQIADSSEVSPQAKATEAPKADVIKLSDHRGKSGSSEKEKKAS